MSVFKNAGEAYASFRKDGLSSAKARSKAAKTFGIDEDSVKKSYSRHKELHTLPKEAPSQVLSFEEEECVVAYCVISSGMSRPVTVPELRTYVSKNYREVGSTWPYRFVKRHGDRLVRIREQILVGSKDPAVNKNIVNDMDRFARAWPDFVKSNGITAAQVITFDETLLNSQALNARSIGSKKEAYHKTAGDVFSMSGSLTLFVSASGRHVLSLYCLKPSKGTKGPPSALLHDFPHLLRSTVNRAYCFSQNGYVTEEILKNAQKKCCEILRNGPDDAKTLVFLCDQLDVHKKTEVIEELLDNGCRLFSLVAGATELLAPLDKITFGVFKKVLKEKLRTANMNMSILAQQNKGYSRKDFFWDAVYEAEVEAIRTETTRKAFEVTGIWPPDSDIIKSCLESVNVSTISPVEDQVKTLGDKLIQHVKAREEDAFAALDRVNNRKRKVSLGEDGSAVFTDVEIIEDNKRKAIAREKMKKEAASKRKKRKVSDENLPDSCIVM
jgi:hypothetical protein